jgi:hypothetical protein
MEFQSGDIQGKSLQERVNAMLQTQTKEWDLAARNYKGLEKVIKHTHIMNGGLEIDVQYNPERIYSSAAKVDKKSISERKCFLCLAHLPSEQQRISYYEKYVVLVNPFPIFPRHLTIPHREHTQQKIEGHMKDMLLLARELDQFVVFYNGPRCGASAPDHFHFQAGNKGFMPVEKDFHDLQKSLIKKDESCIAWAIDDYLRYCLVLEGDDPEAISSWFDRILKILILMNPGEDEPMMNVLASWENGVWRVFIFPRKMHRPWQFFAEGEEQILLSPASVDLGGVLILPREADQEKLNNETIADIFDQVTIAKEDFEQLCTEFTR